MYTFSLLNYAAFVYVRVRVYVRVCMCVRIRGRGGLVLTSLACLCILRLGKGRRGQPGAKTVTLRSDPFSFESRRKRRHCSLLSACLLWTSVSKA